jgi:sulfur carrier protein
MQIVLNGEPRELAPATTFSELMAAVAPGGRRVAVEVNGEILPRSHWSARQLADGDRVEVIHAVGGG